MPVKLIIFDLDGTLVDTSRDITNALNYAFEPYSLKILTVEDTIKMVGEGITRLVEGLLGNEKSHVKDTVIKRFLEYYSEHLIEYSTIYPHVIDTLEKLSGYKKAVISNKREFLSIKLLDKLNLLKYFDLVVGSDTISEKKPSALPVKYTLSKLGAEPDESIIVGDSNYDIEAGKNAAVNTIAVTYGYRERRYLMDADFIIDSLKELPGIIFKYLIKKQKA